MDGPRGTTILCVRRPDAVALGGDGQVTLGDQVLKHSATKVRRLLDGRVLAAFAGATADAFTLLERFEERLKEHPGASPAPPSRSPGTGEATGRSGGWRAC